jgi:hypothetical protein
MLSESMTIEKLESLIDEYQKKIRLNFNILNNDDLTELEKVRITDEINSFKELISGYQSELRKLYQELFTIAGKKKINVDK